MARETTKSKQDKVGQADQLKQKINNFLIKHFRWIIFAIIIIIFVGGYFIFILPKYNQIVRDVQLQADELEKKYSFRQQYLTQLIHLKVAYKQISQENKDKIEAMLPSSPKVEDLISEIETISLKNGLTLTNLSVEPAEAIGEKTGEILNGVANVKITMEIVGTDYYALKNILKTIENNLRLMDIISVNYLVGDKKTSLVLQAYYLP